MAVAPRPLPAFAPYSTAHLVVLAIFIVGLATLILVARHLRGTRALRQLEIGLALIGIGFWVAIAIWWLLPAQLRWDKSLPMAMCDWASLIAPLGLLWPRRLLTTLTYFWGIGLCTQAFFTPTITVGPADTYFWIFWFQHSIIVGCAIYEFAVRGYRPTWTDFWAAIAASYAYLGVAMLVNHFLAANYGYVGNQTPETPTIVDRLGPWPRRVLWIIVLVHVVFAVAMLPALIADRVTRRGKQRELQALD